MLLWELHSDFLQYFSVISLEICIETSITIDNDEAELVIILKKDMEGFCLELARATVNVLINGLEWLKIKVDHLLGFSIVKQDFTAEDNQSVLRCLVVILQLAQC